MPWMSIDPEQRDRALDPERHAQSLDLRRATLALYKELYASWTIDGETSSVRANILRDIARLLKVMGIKPYDHTMKLDETSRRKLADDYRQMAIDETDGNLIAGDADVEMTIGGAFVATRSGLWHRVYATADGANDAAKRT